VLVGVIKSNRHEGFTISRARDVQQIHPWKKKNKTVSSRRKGKEVVEEFKRGRPKC
jgi:hypothetical protein